MAANTLDVDEIIHLVDGDFQFVQQVGSIVRLRNVTDRTYLDLHVAVLTEKLVGLPVFASPSERMITHLPDEVRRDTMTWVNHLDEILTGINPLLNTGRPEYDLTTTTQEQRIATKIPELKAFGYAASRATLMRKLKKYQQEGAASLIDKRSLRPDDPFARLDERVYDAICWVISDQTRRSTGTTERMIHEVAAELIKRHGANAPAMPSNQSMYRHFAHLTKGKQTTGDAPTRRSYDKRPKRMFGTRSESLPGASVQIDSTTLDCFVRTSFGPIRPILTVLFDTATRCIIAHTLRITAAKAIDHVDLLAQALTPHQNRPDNTTFRAAVQRANPQVTLLTPEERRQYETQHPYIFPDEIVMDNGKDFIADTFRAALSRFGISVVYSAPHTPTDKPLVERNFGSLNTLLNQHLPGYVGSSTAKRGANPEEEYLLDFYALHEVLDDFILRVWNHRPHGGLPDPMHPRVKFTPAQAFAAASQVTSTLKLTLTEADYIELLPTMKRTIQIDGIHIHNRVYDSPALSPHRNRKATYAVYDGEWEIKSDPYNQFVIWVRMPDGNLTEVPMRGHNRFLQPHLHEARPTMPPERVDVPHMTAALTGVPKPKRRAAPATPAEVPELETATTVATTDSWGDIDAAEYDIDAFDPDAE